jgi:hypothetical protein
MIPRIWSCCGAAALAAMLASTLGAQPRAPAAPCPVGTGALTGALAGWDAAAPATSATIAIGRPARVRLSAAPAPDMFETTLAFQVVRAGRYEVALSNGAWIDVVANGETLRSADHRHGPACSSVHKIVAFVLAPGAHSLRIVRSPASDVTVAIVPA